MLISKDIWVQREHWMRKYLFWRVTYLRITYYEREMSHFVWPHEPSTLRLDISKTKQVKNKTRVYSYKAKWAQFKTELVLFFEYVLDHINDLENSFSY